MPEILNTKSCSQNLMKSANKQHIRSGLISSSKQIRKSKLNTYSRKVTTAKKRRSSSHSDSDEDFHELDTSNNVNVKQVESKTFDGIPKEWH